MGDEDKVIVTTTQNEEGKTINWTLDENGKLVGYDEDGNEYK